MADNVSFPLFVFEKDDCSMFLVEGLDKVLNHMEPIDIQNGEYLFWDSYGKGVQISEHRAGWPLERLMAATGRRTL